MSNYVTHIPAAPSADAVAYFSQAFAFETD